VVGEVYNDRKKDAWRDGGNREKQEKYGEKTRFAGGQGNKCGSDKKKINVLKAARNMAWPAVEGKRAEDRATNMRIAAETKANTLLGIK